MSTRIYLVRHGSTMLSAEDAFAGSTDVDLSPEGRRQAELLSDRLAHDNICAAYCSPMRRTVDTARIIAGPFGLEPERRDGLRELSHGHWEGMRRADVEAQYADEYASWEADPFTFAPQGGESGLSVMARALPVMRRSPRTSSRRSATRWRTPEIRARRPFRNTGSATPGEEEVMVRTRRFLPGERKSGAALLASAKEENAATAARSVGRARAPDAADI